jgi:hypothetical protein
LKSWLVLKEPNGSRSLIIARCECQSSVDEKNQPTSSVSFSSIWPEAVVNMFPAIDWSTANHFMLFLQLLGSILAVGHCAGPRSNDWQKFSGSVSWCASPWVLIGAGPCTEPHAQTITHLLRQLYRLDIGMYRSCKTTATGES